MYILYRFRIEKEKKCYHPKLNNCTRWHHGWSQVRSSYQHHSDWNTIVR